MLTPFDAFMGRRSFDHKRVTIRKCILFNANYKSVNCVVTRNDNGVEQLGSVILTFSDDDTSNLRETLFYRCSGAVVRDRCRGAQITGELISGDDYALLSGNVSVKWPNHTEFYTYTDANGRLR